jgi:anti-sigma factor (TIGR02949 family)
MDCREIQKYLHVYLDQEFDERERGEIEGHLAACAACMRQARFEQWFREAFRRSVRAETPPPGLAERIRAELDRVPEPPRARLSPFAMFAGPVAAFLVLGILLGYVWSLSALPLSDAPPRLAAMPGEGESPGAIPAAHPVTAAVAATPAPAAPAPQPAPEPALKADPEPARRVARSRPKPLAREVATAAAERPRAEPAPLPCGERELPLEVASSDPGEVRSWLRARLAWPVEVPTFRGRARLLGGSAATDDATAQIIYRHRKQHLTLHISRRHDPSLPDQGIVVRQDGAHQVALWRRGGLTYSMTSMLDPVELVKLVATEINPPRRPARAPASWVATEPNYSEARPVSTNP